MHLTSWLESVVRRIQVGRWKKRSRPYRERFMPRLRVTRMEPRRVLNATPVPIDPTLLAAMPAAAAAASHNPNVLIVQAVDQTPHTGQNALNPSQSSSQSSSQSANTVELLRDGNKVDVIVNGTLTQQADASKVGSIEVVAGQAPETLIIDFSGGNPLPAG